MKELLLKDVRCLVRSKGATASVFVLTLLLVVVSAFSFRDVGRAESYYRDLAPGVLWIIFFFAGTLFLNHSFGPEYDEDALLGAVGLSSADPGQFFLSKLTVNVLFLAALQIGSAVCYELFFSAGLLPYLAQFAILAVLVSFGFAALGTLLSSISCLSAGRALLLPVLLFPLLIPLASCAVFLSRALFDGAGLDYRSFWFVLLAVFDIVSAALGLILFEFVVSE